MVFEQRWHALQARYNAWSRRERLLVALAMVLGPALMINALWLEPQAVQRKALQTKIAGQEASINQMQAQVSALDRKSTRLNSSH